MSKQKRNRNTQTQKPKKDQSKKARYAHVNLDTKNTLLFLGIFIVLSFVLYHSSLNFGFVLDDKIVLSENEYTKKGLAGIGDLLGSDSFQGYFGEQKEILQGGRYRPLSLISFAVEHQVFGLNAMVYHLNNILIYGFSIFIAFLTLRRVFKNKSTDALDLVLSTSFLACLIFLVHPIHTEAVANIKGRDEILSFLFSMLTLLFAFRYYDKNKWSELIWANIFFMLGFLSKENTMTFLAIVPVALLLFRKSNIKKISPVVISLLVTTVLYFIIRIQALGYFLIDNPSTDIMNNPFVNMGAIEKYATITYTLLVYLKLIFVPIELTHDYYPFHIPTMNLGQWQVWLSLIIHGFMVYTIIRYWNQKKKIVFGLFFYLAALSIVSNIVINVGTTMNERFIFTALLGFCIVLVVGMKQLVQHFGSTGEGMKAQWPLLAMLGTLIVLYSFKTLDRVPAWESELKLNQAAIKVSKNSARANSFTATAYFNTYKETTDREERKKLLELAKPYSQKAIELYPAYMNANIMVAGIAAEEFKFDGDIDKLLSSFKAVATRRPDVEYLTTYLNYLNDRGVHPDKMIQFYIELGRDELLNNQRKLDWAVHYLLMGNSIDPANVEIRSALIQAYELMGRTDLANRYR